MAARRPSWLLVLGGVCLAVATVVTLQLVGAVDLGAVTDPQRVQAVVETAGPAGPVVFVLLTLVMHLAQVGGFSTLIAVAIWPTPVAVALCWAAGMVSALTIFAVVRRLGQDWAQRRVPPKLRAVTEKLESRPVATVVVARSLLHINFGLDCVLALSQIRFRTLVLFTAVGLVPSTLVNVALNTALLTVAAQVPPWGWVVLAAAVVVALALWFARRRRARGRSTTGPAPASAATEAPFPATGQHR